MTTGKLAMTAAAKIRFHLISTSESKVAMATWMTRTSGEDAAISGQRNESHESWNRMIAKAISAGSELGMMIRTNAPNREHPSIRAASSSSYGIPRKNWRSRNMPNGEAAKGMISARYVLTQSNSRISRYKGTTITSKGMIVVAMNSAKSWSR